MASLARASAPFRQLYDALVQRLTDSATADGALKTGDAFPEFALADVNGRFALSSDLLRLGPLVVNFYRGRWCPYCTAAVEAMSAAAPTISAAGATVIGISPELGNLSFSASHDASRDTSHDRGLNFKMLCDIDNGLALQCGLLFRLTDDIIAEYLADGLDLRKVYGNDSWFLPIRELHRRAGRRDQARLCKSGLSLPDGSRGNPPRGGRSGIAIAAGRPSNRATWRV